MKHSWNKADPESCDQLFLSIACLFPLSVNMGKGKKGKVTTALHANKTAPGINSEVVKTLFDNDNFNM